MRLNTIPLPYDYYVGTDNSPKTFTFTIENLVT